MKLIALNEGLYDGSGLFIYDDKPVVVICLVAVVLSPQPLLHLIDELPVRPVEIKDTPLALDFAARTVEKVAVPEISGEAVQVTLTAPEQGGVQDDAPALRQVDQKGPARAVPVHAPALYLLALSVGRDVAIRKEAHPYPSLPV